MRRVAAWAILAWALAGRCSASRSSAARRLAHHGAGGANGSALADASACSALLAAARVPSASIRSVAVVGNGPLSASQRQEIEQADLVVRFNKLDNWHCSDRLDVWVTRFACNAPYWYHGFRQLKTCTTEQALGQARAIFMLNSLGEPAVWRDRGVADLAQDFPRFGAVPRQRFDAGALLDTYRARVGGQGDPSSGWAGLLLALECAPEAAAVALYGFNWSPENWGGHRMGAEERYVRALLAASGRLRLHPAPCGGFRACGGCPVVDDLAGPPGGAAAGGRNATCAGGPGGAGPSDVDHLAATVAMVNARRNDSITWNATTMIIEGSVLTDSEQKYHEAERVAAQLRIRGRAALPAALPASARLQRF